jgi:Rap1a immunity proteins
MATMLTSLRLLAVFVACIMPQALLADAYLNGNTLYAKCTGTADDQLVCLGYVMGVADGMSSNNQKVICVPHTVTNFQVRDVAAKFLRDHPEWRHFLAADLVTQALKNAFPCT